MTLKTLNPQYAKRTRKMTVMGVGLLLGAVSLISLTCWSAEATGFNRRPTEADNSIPALQGAAAITYLKERKLYDSLSAALNTARTRRGDSSLLTPLVLNEQKLTASDGGIFENFGGSVAISGSTIVVGAPRDNIGSNSLQGSAYVFNRHGGNWVEMQKLTASDGAGFDSFGFSVAISGSTIVVGATFDNIGGNLLQGSAYVFNRQGGSWVETQKLTASDGAANNLFGNSVAVSGATIVVSAPRANIAYVFDRHGGGWVETQKLTASDGAAGFGASVAVGGATILVAAPFDDIGGNISQGSAFVFNRQGGNWVEMQKLTASDGAAHDDFGWSVAVSGPTLIVGVPFDGIGGKFNQGSAYVYNRQGGSWVEMQKLTASDGAADDFFAWSVAISGSTVVVGTPSFFTGGDFKQGSAYVFNREDGSWLETQKLTASDGEMADDDRFGLSVAISGSTIVVGADSDDIGSNFLQGSAYVFVP